MLRKRSRPVQNHSSRAELMRARASDAVAATARAASFFTAPGIFVGLSNKGSSDCDSSMSPTSPLEFRASTLLGSSSPSRQQSPKCWDCRRVGLSLVDSLNHETMSCGKVLRFARSQRINIAIPKISLDVDVDDDYHSTSAANSLPKNYSMSSSMTNIFAFPSDAAASSLPLSRKIHNNLKTNIDVFHTKLGCPLEVEGKDAEKVSASLPISIGEIELSEDYTCIISHGPNPKTTHIFGDCILESHSFHSPDRMSRKGEVVEEEPSPRADFLSLCFSCKKKLEEGKDIYIYGGEKAFCSCECRDKEILIEEQMEKPTADFSDWAESSSFELEIQL